MKIIIHDILTCPLRHDRGGCSVMFPHPLNKINGCKWWKWDKEGNRQKMVMPEDCPLEHGITIELDEKYKDNGFKDANGTLTNPECGNSQSQRLLH